MVVHIFSMPQVMHVTLDDFESGAHMKTSSHATDPTIRLFRNTDQRLDILIKDIDRRPVLLDTTEQVRLRVFNRLNQVVLDVPAIEENYEKGHFQIKLTRAQTGALALGDHRWCMIAVNTDTDDVRLLHTDQWYGASAPLKVIEGPEPRLPAATQIDPQGLTGGKTSALPGAAQTINLSGVHSVALGLDEFTGSVYVDATLDIAIPESDDEWTEISVTAYENVTGTRHISFTGNYTWVRLKFTSLTGLTQITYRNL